MRSATGSRARPTAIDSRSRAAVVEQAMRPAEVEQAARPVMARARPGVIKAPKADSAAACLALEQLPNIGPALAADLRSIGVVRPADLRGQDAFVLYQKLCALTGQRHDPCVLDTFMAAVDFMRGAPAAPWWHYTKQRKVFFGSV